MLVLVISFSDISRDGRVQRQIGVLRRELGVQVQAYCTGKGDDTEGVSWTIVRESSLWERLPARLWLVLRWFERAYWAHPRVKQGLEAFSSKKFDLVVANDVLALPLGWKIARASGAKLLFDAHEYTPAEFEDRFVWRMLLQGFYGYLSRKHVPLADAMTTVSEGIAQAWNAFCGVRPFVVLNAPDYEELNPRPVQDGVIRMIHHGGACRSRKLELMLDLMHRLGDRFQLTLRLVPGDKAYIRELKEIAAPLGGRVRFEEPVSPKQIARMCNEHDIGLYLMPPLSKNNLCALPNKFLEFIQGRLAVAVYPIPEMKRITEKWGCGVVSDEYSVEAIAKKLQGLSTEKIMEMKWNAHRAANALCNEANLPRWREAFSLLGLK